MAFTRQIMNAQGIVLRYYALIIRHEVQVIWNHAVYHATKVKFTLLQASWPLRGGRGIDLPILNLGTRKGWVVRTTPRPLYPRERPGTHCTVGWVGPTAGLDVCEKSRPHRDSIHGPSSP
jgi:hypothetical protein